MHSKNVGERLDALQSFPVSEKIGIDLQTINICDDAQYDWLQSLIWPELTERKANLEAARRIYETAEATLYDGDFRTLMPHIIRNIGKESQLIIFHTHVANQFPQTLKEELLALLDDISMSRSLYHMYNNMYDGQLHVDYVQQRKTVCCRTMTTEAHGAHFAWK